MRFLKVTAHSFGPFQGDELELAPGMNVIAGPNEAGKSTWHAAIYAALCGVRRGPGQPSRVDREFASRHRPWESDTWDVSCEVVLPDGRHVELRHDLAGKVDCKATDIALGHDLSSEIIHDGAPDGSRWLGLDRRTFLSVACVRQAEILAVTEHADALQEHLQRAAATAGTDETAAAALKAIEDFQRDHVGLRRANSTRPLMTALKRVADAKQHHEVAVAAHAAWLEQEEAVAVLTTVAAEARTVAVAAEAAVAHADSGHQTERARRARALADRHPEPPPDAQEDDALAAQVVTAIQGWEQRPRLSPLEGESVDDLRARLAEVPEEPEGDLEPHLQVTTSQRKLLDARSQLLAHRQQRPAAATPLDAGGATEAELVDLARELESPVPPVDEALRARVERLRDDATPAGRAGGNRFTVGVAIALVVLGGLLLALGQAAPGAAAVVVGLVVGAVGAFVPGTRGDPAPDGPLRAAEMSLELAEQLAAGGRQRRDVAVQRARSLGLEPDAATLRRLADGLRRNEQAAAAEKHWTISETRLEAPLDEARTRVIEALESRGVEVDPRSGDDELDAILDRYEDECRQRRRSATAAAQRHALERAVAARDREEQRHAEDEARLADARRALREAAAAVETEGDEHDEDRLVDQLREWQRRREANLVETRLARDEWTELQALLDGETIDALEASAAKARQRAEAIAASVGETGAPAELGPDPRRTVDDLRRAADKEQRAADAARGDLQARAESLASVPEAEEEVAAAHEELARVEALDETLATTCKLLEAAQDRVHRDIAPVLIAKVQDRLARVTAGRYREVTVDPHNLEVKVRDPNGHLRSAGLLSHGTAEQVYLLLRIAMAEILTGSDAKSPLLLDDVAVQSDPARSRALLEVLHEASAEHQVILFSQELDVLDWARANLDDGPDRLVELTAP